MKKLILKYVLASVFLVGCSKGNEDPPSVPSNPTSNPGSDEDETENPTSNPDFGGDEPENPTSVELVFPLKDSECEEGSDSTAEESTVTFEWKKSSHTDIYELTITDLSSGTVDNYLSTTENLPLRLQRGVPYEWYITSQSYVVATTAKSEVWRFYNQGEGNENYIPFPAQAVFPSDNTSLSGFSIVLEWSGMDVDNDIVGYDVYLGTNNPPTNLLIRDTDEERLSNISVSVNKYYWFVVTKDGAGNESESQIFSFTIE